MKTLDEVVEKLPPDLQREVEDFAKFLLQTRAQPKSGKLGVEWAGALSEFRERFTSLELQKKALEWLGESFLADTTRTISHRDTETRRKARSQVTEHRPQVTARRLEATGYSHSRIQGSGLFPIACHL